MEKNQDISFGKMSQEPSLQTKEDDFKKRP